jgi:endonuclease G
MPPQKKSLTKPESDGGYKPAFLGKKFSIPFPTLNKDQKKDLVKIGGSKSKIDFIHYSVVLCKSRRQAYFTAVNIDGNTWQDNPRLGDWQHDPRIAKEDQLGQKMYDAKKSNFDRGHLVRREDPEWGAKEKSIRAGENTFWFPNCSPQHLKLNQKIWADLEANILHIGADQQNLKVNVFTGPVLADNDGVFVTQVEGKDIKIPNLFWKIVVWTKSNGKAYAVGFLQSQEKFLIDDGIIKKPIVISKKKPTDEDIFEHLEFKDGKTYQVKIDKIEKLTGLKFNWPGVIKPFKKAKAKVITGVKTKPHGKLKVAEPGLKRSMDLKGLVL